MKRFRQVAFGVCVAVTTVACAAAPAPEAVLTTFVLVRHAEKATGDDPPLTPAGAARARELARVAADVRLDAVYATPFRRTQQTARPAAETAGVEVRVDAVRTDDIAGHYAKFVEELLQRHAGKRVLLVGHSNTVPAIIEALGAKGAPRLNDEDYDDLFVVVVSSVASLSSTGSAIRSSSRLASETDDFGRAELLHLHYGDRSP